MTQDITKKSMMMIETSLHDGGTRFRCHHRFAELRTGTLQCFEFTLQIGVLFPPGFDFGAQELHGGLSKRLRFPSDPCAFFVVLPRFLELSQLASESISLFS